MLKSASGDFYEYSMEKAAVGDFLGDLWSGIRGGVSGGIRGAGAGGILGGTLGGLGGFAGPEMDFVTGNLGAAGRGAMAGARGPGPWHPDLMFRGREPAGVLSRGWRGTKGALGGAATGAAGGGLLGGLGGFAEGFMGSRAEREAARRAAAGSEALMRTGLKGAGLLGAGYLLSKALSSEPEYRPPMVRRLPPPMTGTFIGGDFYRV